MTLPAYPFLAALFFATLLSAVALGVRALVFWRRKNRPLRFEKGFGLWLVVYGVFIFTGTGPRNLNEYPIAELSPYVLPWQAGVRRFVAQGNRSFTSHRDGHEHAWDFVMAQGTPVLAAREGKVLEVEDGLDGIGPRANFVIVEHVDGTRAVYAHIRLRSAKVRVGESVAQGQTLALSGMVGQTIFPHLHFVVLGKEGKISLPIAFRDVPGGVPLAGRFYTAGTAQ